MGGVGGGPCDFGVSPSPFGLDFGTLDFGTSDLGLTIFFYFRLSNTRVELGGWPPVLLCFEQISDRDVVFNRASCLERTGLMVTDIFECFCC